METIRINGIDYGYVNNYRKDFQLRNKFNRLARKVYQFDFESWYQNGYWGNNYIPYSLVYGDTMISNISVNVIDFLVQGQKSTFIQIGTVMTDPEYRNKGLNRVLLEKVLAEWREKTDLIYLFANESVLDFYPKFGFSLTQEYQYSKQMTSDDSRSHLKKLAMSDKAAREFFLNKIKRSLPFSQVTMLNNSNLLMFPYITFCEDNIYYIKELDAVAIAEYDHDVLLLKDVFCEKEVSIDLLIAALIRKEVNRVVLGFTPKDKTSFDENPLISVDTLFVLDNKLGLFESERLQFPVLSHA